jgi:glycosyltransferase involved in cell wall biosynthesis
VTGETPRVSICIPTVNRLGYLREAIASAQRQTYQDFEVVVSENSGDPSYAAQVEQLAQEFSGVRLRVLHQHPPVDMATHANFLIDAARGAYWVYLPDDDRLHPEFLAVLVPVLDAHAEVGFAFCDHAIIGADGVAAPRLADENSRRYGRHELAPGVISHERLPALALRATMTIQCALFRRELVSRVRFRSENALVVDYDLMLRIACDPGAKAGYYCPRRLVEYRRHADQVTRGMSAGEIHSVSIRVLEACSVPGDCRTLYQGLLAQHYTGLALSEACAGRRRSALASARRSLGLQLSTLGILIWAAVLCLPASALLSLRQARRWIVSRRPVPVENA